MLEAKGKPRGNVALEYCGKKYYFKTREEAEVGKRLHEHASSVKTVHGRSPAESSTETAST